MDNSSCDCLQCGWRLYDEKKIIKKKKPFLFWKYSSSVVWCDITDTTKRKNISDIYKAWRDQPVMNDCENCKIGEDLVLYFEHPEIDRTKKKITRIRVGKITVKVCASHKKCVSCGSSETLCVLLSGGRFFCYRCYMDAFKVFHYLKKYKMCNACNAYITKRQKFHHFWCNKPGMEHWVCFKNNMEAMTTGSGNQYTNTNPSLAGFICDEHKIE